MAKTAREAMKAKARRMASGDPHAKVDASSWTPDEPLNTEAKTGMRPVSRQHLKTGGKVHGEKEAQRADRKPRKAGGLVHDLMNRDQKAANEGRKGVKHVGGMKRGGAAEWEGSAKDEAEDKMLARKHKMSMKAWERSGADKIHDRGHKAHGGASDGDMDDMNKGGSVSDGTMEGTRPMKGGRFARATGGSADDGPMGYHIIDGHTGSVVGKTKNSRQATNMVDRRDNAYGGYRYQRKPIYDESDWGAKHKDDYDRAERKSGGRTKGKTNINIVIAQPHSGEQAPMGGPPMPPQPRGAPMPMPMPPGAAGAGGAGAAPVQIPMPMAGGAPMPQGLGAGTPPMRKAGGRVRYDAGAGSGEGRLEKLKNYGKKA